MTTPRVQSETERAMRYIAGDDPVEQARIDLIVGETRRAAEAQAAADREDVRRAASGRRLLVGPVR